MSAHEESMVYCMISGGSPADVRCFSDPRGRRSVQGFKVNRRDHVNTCVSSIFLVRMVLAPSYTPLTVLAVAICITCLPWFGVERGGDSEVLSQPDPSVELRAQLLDAHRELRGHCETQLATCRRTCPEQKCSLSYWHCWVLLFLVLLAWTV